MSASLKSVTFFNSVDKLIYTSIIDTEDTSKLASAVYRSDVTNSTEKSTKRLHVH